MSSVVSLSFFQGRLSHRSTDQNLRTVYDKHGKKMMEKEGTEIKMEDAAGFFANIFGGDRFVDYVCPSLIFSVSLS